MPNTLPFTIDFAGCPADPSPDRITLLDQTRRALGRLHGWQADGTLPLLNLPAARDDLAALAPVVARWRQEAGDVLVLGIGGSSLGAQALLELRDPADQGPRIHTPDNVDPVSFRRLIDGLDWTGTRLLAVSKSGGTVETVAQLLLILDRMEAAIGRDETAARLVVIAEPGNSPLHRLPAGVKILLVCALILAGSLAGREAWQVVPAHLASKSRNTPFVGVELRGRVRHTILRGQLTVGDGTPRR